MDIWTYARTDDAAAIERLVGEGQVAVDERNDLGETALHVAVGRGNDAVARVLLRHRASLTAKDWESGWTPLHRAIYHDHLSTSLLLLRHAHAQFGKKFMKKYLYETLDNAQQSAMDVLSIRSSDELLLEAEYAPDLAARRGGMVYTFGKRDYQLGYHLPNADVQSTPRRVELSVVSPIRQIGASKYHTIALSAAGECFVWGFGKGGRLGTGTEFDHVEPTRIASLEQIPIARVAAGENHSLALSRTGQVFSWGSNSFGQLGHNVKTLTHEGRLTPKRIDAFKTRVVVEIAASGCHSAAITAASMDGEPAAVFTWGSNKKGQLGRKEGAGTDQPYPTPRPVEALQLDHPLSAIYDDLDDVTPVQLALSDWHSCVILRCTRHGKSHGQVWQFGDGTSHPTRINFRDGQPQRGNLLRDTWTPSFKQRGVDIVQISCAPNHSIALAASGAVYTWGHSESALSHPPKKARQRTGDNSAVPGAPQKVDLSRFGPIANICASQDHCAVVTLAGDLVTWGGGAQGVLGHGQENTWQPSPKRVNGVKKAVSVATGHQHTVVLVAPAIPSTTVMTTEPTSLRALSQRRIAEWLDLSNCATVYKHAETHDTRELRAFCLDYLRRNWDAMLDSMCNERLETLFEYFLPPLDKMVLEQKAPRHSNDALTPALSPQPAMMASDGMSNMLDGFVLGGNRAIGKATNASESTELSTTPAARRIDQAPASTKRKQSKFVSVDAFISKKNQTSKEVKQQQQHQQGASPWIAATPVTTTSNDSPPELKPSRKSSIDLAAIPAPPRRKESISASPHLGATPSPVVSSISANTAKQVLWSDGVERPQVSTFSLDAFIKKPSRNSRKNRGTAELPNQQRAMWGSSEPKPASTAWNGPPPVKTLKEIQAEEEARVAAETAAKAKLGTLQLRTASTVNSWGLCESTGHVSLTDVQKLQEEQALIEEQRQILAAIQRANRSDASRRKEEGEAAAQPKKTKKKKPERKNDARANAPSSTTTPANPSADTDAKRKAPRRRKTAGEAQHQEAAAGSKAKARKQKAEEGRKSAGRKSSSSGKRAAAA